MATSNTLTAGTITWTEIPCTNLDRVQSFYTSVFGWSITTGPDPNVSLFSKEQTHGSFVKLDNPDNLLSPATHGLAAEPDKCRRLAVRVTIAVDSIGEVIKEIEKAGGKLYIPTQEIPGGMGFVSYFTDTENNVLGVWSMKE